MCPSPEQSPIFFFFFFFPFFPISASVRGPWCRCVLAGVYLFQSDDHLWVLQSSPLCHPIDKWIIKPLLPLTPQPFVTSSLVAPVPTWRNNFSEVCASVLLPDALTSLSVPPVFPSIHIHTFGIMLKSFINPTTNSVGYSVVSVDKEAHLCYQKTRPNQTDDRKAVKIKLSQMWYCITRHGTGIMLCVCNVAMKDSQSETLEWVWGIRICLDENKPSNYLGCLKKLFGNVLWNLKMIWCVFNLKQEHHVHFRF